jgi:hypothetical protein
MIRLANSRYGWAASLAAAIVVSACAPLGTPMGDVGIPGGRSSYVDGEIRSIDARSSRIGVRDEIGRNRTIQVDRRTRVVYRQRNYPVSALERGDRVRVRVTHDRDGRAWADRIDVRESVRDRGRHAARVATLDGRVNWVDRRRGSFGLALRSGHPATVYLPRGASRSDQTRFQRLGRGDRVRAEVRLVGRDSYELVRFR